MIRCSAKTPSLSSIRHSTFGTRHSKIPLALEKYPPTVGLTTPLWLGYFASVAEVCCIFAAVQPEPPDTKPSIMRILSLLFFLVSASAAFGQRAYVYDFLRNESSARAAAMGGAFLTVGGDVSGMFYNPALLNTIDSSQVSLTFQKHLLDMNSGYATFTTGIEDVGQIGVGVNYNSYGSFNRTDRNGQADGSTFGASDIAFTVGWGSTLGEGFSAGISGSFVSSTIDNAGSSALALDGGLLFEDTAARFQAGLSLLHVGGQVSAFGEESEELPTDLRLGISHRLRGLPLLIALNFTRLLDPQEDFFNRFASFSVGGEFRLSNPLRLRLGYNNQVRSDVAYGSSKGLGGLSAGIGILVKDYRFDYAFNSLARLGAQHRITLNAAF